MRLRLSCFKKRSGGETNRGTPPALGGNDKHIQYNVRCIARSGESWLASLITYVLGGKGGLQQELCVGKRKGKKEEEHFCVDILFRFLQQKVNFFFF